jgi:hypothetical protein
MTNEHFLAGYDAKYLQRTLATPLELARKRFPRPTIEDLTEALENSIAFLVVREPFERLLSAYRNKMEDGKNTYYKLLGDQIIKKFRTTPVMKGVRRSDDFLTSSHSNFPPIPGTPRPNIQRVSPVRRSTLQVRRSLRRALESDLSILHAMQHQFYFNCQNGNIPTRHRVHNPPSRSRDAAVGQSAENEGAENHESIVEERHEFADTQVSFENVQEKTSH